MQNKIFNTYGVDADFLLPYFKSLQDYEVLETDQYYIPYCNGVDEFDGKAKQFLVFDDFFDYSKILENIPNISVVDMTPIATVNLGKTSEWLDSLTRVKKKLNKHVPLLTMVYYESPDLAIRLNQKFFDAKRLIYDNPHMEFLYKCSYLLNKCSKSFSIELLTENKVFLCQMLGHYNEEDFILDFIYVTQDKEVTKEYWPYIRGHVEAVKMANSLGFKRFRCGMNVECKKLLNFNTTMFKGISK